MAKAWQTHGKRMPNAWQTHGNRMANARQTHGKRTAEQTHGTGPPKGIPENLQGISGTPNGATWDSKGRPREASGKLWRMLVLCSRSEARMPVHAQRCHSNALPVHTLRQVSNVLFIRVFTCFQRLRSTLGESETSVFTHLVYSALCTGVFQYV